MRYLNLQNTMLVSLLVAGVAATAGCSSGTDAPNNPAGSGGSTSGTAGSTGTAGQSSGSAGNTTTGGGNSSGTAGAGNTGGAGGGNSGPSVCDGMGTRPLTAADSKIDDFEAAAISPGWSSFNDVTPTPDSFKIMQEAVGAVGTGHFGHYKGMGAKLSTAMGYGAGTVYNVAIDKAAGKYCVDISAFDGVSFWGKAATAGSKVNLNFVLPETNQIPDNPMYGGGDCVKGTGCFSHPYKAVTLTTDWAQYSVAFADAGMGKLPNTGAAAKVTTRIQQLVWITPDADWDFSIDEIQFYKGTAPTGPVGGHDGGT